MRLKLMAMVMLGVPAMAAAQSAAPVAGGVARLPPIGLPLPQIGLPLPRIGLTAVQAPQPRDGVHHPAPGAKRQHRAAIYFVPTYGWPYLYLYDAPAKARPGALDESARRLEPPSLIGRLRLDVEPGGGDQHVYVDRYYVGTPADFNGELDLEVGPHIVEIRAPGYETLRVSVNIAPGRAITYRGTLKADERPAPDAAVQNSTPVAPATPMTGYIIPGCYLGNVPPQDAGLPASCDVSRVITIQP